MFELDLRKKITYNLKTARQIMICYLVL